MSILSATMLAFALLLGATSTARAQCAEISPQFPAGFDDDVIRFVAFDDGSGPALYAGGEFTQAGGVAATGIARWDGVAWSPVGGGVAGVVGGLGVFDDGSGPALYAGGIFTAAGGVAASNVARWDGSNWSPLGGGTNGVVQAICVFDDGSGPALYVGGQFTTAGGVPAANLARWDGATWTAVGAPILGTEAHVTSLAVYDDGSGPALHVAGWFTSVAGLSASNIAKWDGATWSVLGAPVAGTNSSVVSLVVFDDGSGPSLYIGGYFSTAGGVSCSRIARWDGSNWFPVGSPVAGSTSPVWSLAAFDDGMGAALYASGAFTMVAGLPAARVARWDGASWSGVGVGGLDAPARVYALYPWDDGSGAALYAGHEKGMGGITRWDGSGWALVGEAGNGLNAQVRALLAHDDGSGTALYVAGSFTAAGETQARRIARWDGTAWAPVGGGFDGDVAALATYDDGSGPALYAGGNFTNAGGTAAANIARWDGTGWSALGSPGSGTNGRVWTLSVHDDGSGPALYVGGSFTSTGGTAAANLARWDGTSWSALGAGLNGAVLQLVAHPSGVAPGLYARGSFTTAGGMPAEDVACWDGTSWSALVTLTSNSFLRTLAVHDAGTGSALYLCGLQMQWAGPGGPVFGDFSRWDGTMLTPIPSPQLDANAALSFDDGAGPALYLAGRFSVPGGHSYLRKWDGSLWTELGGVDESSVAHTLALFDDGSDGDPDLFFGGTFTSIGVSSNHFAQWHLCGTTAFCFGDGGGASCPCGNSGSAGHGCANSGAGEGALLSTSGTSLPDALVLTQSGELASSLSIFLQGSTNLATPVAFGDGLRCIGGSLKRLYVKNALAGHVSAPATGDPSITARSTALGDPIASGSTRYYQVYYRDPSSTFCPGPQGGTFNVGNALRVVW